MVRQALTSAVPPERRQWQRRCPKPGQIREFIDAILEQAILTLFTDVEVAARTRSDLELRRNTSKQGFDVLRSSDKAPTCRNLVGSCFTASSDKLAQGSDKLPHLQQIPWPSLWRHRTQSRLIPYEPR